MGFIHATNQSNNIAATIPSEMLNDVLNALEHDGFTIIEAHDYSNMIDSFLHHN